MNLTFNDALIYTVSFFGLYTAIFYLLTLYENGEKWSTMVPKRKRWPGVTVIVPCYNEEKTVRKTLESLLNLDYPREKLSIIVVDDGSTDHTYQEVLPFKKRGVALYRKKNGGKHTALNYVLKRVTTPFVAALDADSTVEPDALKKLVARFTDERIMAVTPSLKIDTPKGVLRRIQAIEFMIGIFLRRVFADLGSQHVTPGPFTVYRTRFFREHGLYREAYRTEDIEVGLRIQSKQYHIENATDAYVYTHGPGTFRSLYRQRIRWYKGFLKNVLAYKELFGKQHGNLGLFVLPSALVSVFLVIISLVYVLGKMVVNWWRTLHYYAAVGFDVWKLFDPNFNPFFLNMSAPIILGFIGIIISIFLFLVSRYLGKDNYPWKLSYLFFFLFYWALFGFWWIVAGLYALFGRDTGWGHKSEVSG